MRRLLSTPQGKLTPILLSGDIADCERTVAARLKKPPRSPFHIVLDLSITNRQKDITAH
jgi:hypothetical protein